MHNHRSRSKERQLNARQKDIAGLYSDFLPAVPPGTAPLLALKKGSEVWDLIRSQQFAFRLRLHFDTGLIRYRLEGGDVTL
jgi:hypothetical protein